MKTNLLARMGASTTAVFALIATALGPVDHANAVVAWAPDVGAIERSGIPVNYSEGNHLLFVREEGGSAITAVYSRVPNDPESLELCDDIGPRLDCNRGNSRVNVGGTALLPVCSGVIENCIESLAVKTAEAEEFETATYVGTTAGTYFKGSPSIGVPSGVGPAIFNSQIAHTGGNEYTIRASLGFSYEPQNTQRRFSPGEFSIRLYASSPISGNYRPAQAEVCIDTPNFGSTLSPCIDEGQECTYVDTGVCGVEHEFAEGTTFKISVILTNELTGWFRGRLQAPSIEVEPISGSYNRVTISGDPVLVPRFLAPFSLERGDPNILGPMSQLGFGGPYTLFEAATPRAMQIVQGMRNRVNETAAGISNVWSINTIGMGAASGQDVRGECLADNTRLLGMVTTNAMTYLGGVPSYRNGFLSYTVAGLHYAPDGQTVNLGTYDLVMRSDVARCLYGFSQAPVSATVSVIGDQGEEKIATTIVSERNGWLKLAAYGFTFSEKQIQVQLRQSQQRNLTNFVGNTTRLSNQQRAEIRAVLARSTGNTKFICTGIRFINQPVSENIRVRARAKAACDYAKSLNPNLSYWFQTKTTTARSFNGRVIVVSKN